MKIRLDKQHILYSDTMNLWIVKEQKIKTGKKAGRLEEVKVAGYCGTIEDLLLSVRARKLRLSGVSTFEGLISENAMINKSLKIWLEEISIDVNKYLKGGDNNEQ